MIPGKLLVIHDWDPDAVTIGEVRLFQGGQYDLMAFREFLIRYTNWTEMEIDKIRRRECTVIYSQIVEKLNELAVPLANPAA